MIMTFFFSSLCGYDCGTAHCSASAVFAGCGLYLDGRLDGVTVLTGFRGVINSISMVVPFIDVSFGICLLSVVKPPDILWRPAAEGNGLSVTGFGHVYCMCHTI